MSGVRTRGSSKSFASRHDVMIMIKYVERLGIGRVGMVRMVDAFEAFDTFGVFDMVYRYHRICPQSYVLETEKRKLEIRIQIDRGDSSVQGPELNVQRAMERWNKGPLDNCFFGAFNCTYGRFVMLGDTLRGLWVVDLVGCRLRRVDDFCKFAVPQPCRGSKSFGPMGRRAKSCDAM